MAQTIQDKVIAILAEQAVLEPSEVRLDATLGDLGIDSLDFLDIAFAIDKAFGIKLPLEKWTQEVNEGKAKTEDYFVLGALCNKIDELVAAKEKELMAI